MIKSNFVDFEKKPVTSFIFCTCCLVWFIIQSQNLGYHHVGSSHENVVVRKEYWRFFLSQISHIDFFHLAMNMSSLNSIGYVETTRGMGSYFYFRVTLLLMLGSKTLHMGLCAFMIEVMKKSVYRRTLSVGYSSILFGWMAFLSVRERGQRKTIKIFGLLEVPMSYAPFASLISTSIAFPQASFSGHLCGILAGYLIAFGNMDRWTLI